jgi:hypothetical protein
MRALDNAATSKEKVRAEHVRDSATVCSMRLSTSSQSSIARLPMAPTCDDDV